MMDLHDYAGADAWRWRVRPPYRPLVTIFCESPMDVVLYDSLLGATLAQLVRFAAPPEKKGGRGWAVGKMREARRACPEPISGNLHHAYALLDGEERLRTHAKYSFLLRDVELQRDDRIIHAKPRDEGYFQEHQRTSYEETDGILFLNAHEYENLFYLYGGAWDLLKKGWKPVKLFGKEEVGSTDIWMVLARAAAYSLLISVVKRYDLNAKDVMKASALLKQSHYSTLELVEAALKPLKRHLLDREVPNRIVAQEFAEIRHALRIMDQRIDLYPHIRFRMLRFCDPKAWFAIANTSQKLDWHELRTNVLASPLSGRFQADLIHVLLGAPRLSRDGTELAVGDWNIGLSARLPRS